MCIRDRDYKDMSRKAANIISAQVIMKPNCVLGLATGSTPIGTYEQLVEWYKKGDLDFAEVKTANLDEYKGLPRDNDQSYYYFMNFHLFSHVNIDPANTHIPDGMEPDAEKECSHYEEVLAGLGGVDLQLLGLGHNGHIGFNEPDEEFDKLTHCVNLTESTICLLYTSYHGSWSGSHRQGCGRSCPTHCGSVPGLRTGPLEVPPVLWELPAP